MASSVLEWLAVLAAARARLIEVVPLHLVAVMFRCHENNPCVPNLLLANGSGCQDKSYISNPREVDMAAKASKSRRLRFL